MAQLRHGKGMSPERKSHATSSLRFSPVTKLWSERETVVGRMPKPRAQREAERRSKPALGAAPDACRADGDGFERASLSVGYVREVHPSPEHDATQPATGVKGTEGTQAARKLH